MRLLLITTLCLIVGKTVIAQSCSVNNLPTFENQNERPHIDTDEVQVIVPSYTFNCPGRVVQYGACVQPGGNSERDLYELELQVLRPLPVDQNDIQCFSLVGSYSQTGGPNFPPDDINRCILIDIPSDDQIPVQPGDVVGFYYDLMRNDDGGVQLDTARTDVTVFYRERTNIPAPNPSSCMFITGPNNIDSTTTAAPVITVVVGGSRWETCLLTSDPAPSPTPPAVVPSSTPPAVAPSPTPPAVAPSPTPPAVAPSSTPPAVAPSPTPPAVTDDPLTIVTTSPGDPPVMEPVESIVPGESPAPPNPGSPSGGGGGDGTLAAIGVVVALLVVIVVVVVVLVILFALRRRNKSREKFTPQPRNAIENPNYESGPAKIKHKRMSKNNYTTNKSITGSEQPEDYTNPLSQYSSDPSYTYISSGSNSTATTGFYPAFESSEIHYEDPSALSYRTQDPDTFGSAGMYVPTEEQRIAAGNHYEMLETHEYNTLKFFVEDQTYWAPASTTSGLYAQLADKKYREIPRDQIVLGDKLGSGQFGEVCKSQWRFSGTSLEAAAKTLKTNAPVIEKVRFLQEAAIMGQFSHPNIVRLYGVVTMREPSMIVLELMPNGDLRSYLQKLEWDDGRKVQHMFLRFAREIAAGMAYLSKKSFVHRDLAARNILLDQNLKCKIGDFGLARDLMEDTYYTSKGGQVPIKWTAPEALHYKKYSVSSDVWSYAMVLFEIWSVGQKPFPNLSNKDVVALVQTGHCQPPVPGCPREIYRLMVDCWNPAHHERPTFVGVSEYLSQPDSLLLSWKEGDASSGQKARELGAAISESRHLFLDLQHKYK